MLCAVVMASGQSVRFNAGEAEPQNKLLLPFGGIAVIEAVLSALPDELSKKLVVTRSREIERIAERCGCTVILHELPNQADTIRIGIENAGEADGCLFLVGDQPLIRRGTLERMMAEAQAHPKSIIRLRSGNTAGNPVLFPKELFYALATLAPNETGAAVIKNSDAEVRYIEALSPLELLDIDTREDYKILLKVLENQNSVPTN